MQALQNKTLAALESNTNALKSLGHHQQSSFLMIDILIEICKQTNKQFQLISVDPNLKKFKRNGADVSLVPDGIKMKGKVYDFSKGFAMFITSKYVTERDIKGDEINIKQFLKDIDYKQRGENKSKRSKVKGKMFASISEPTSQVISIPTSS